MLAAVLHAPQLWLHRALAAIALGTSDHCASSGCKLRGARGAAVRAGMLGHGWADSRLGSVAAQQRVLRPANGTGSPAMAGDGSLARGGCSSSGTYGRRVWQ